MIVSKVEKEDLGKIAFLEKELEFDKWSENSIFSEIDNDDFLVLKINDDIIGYIIAYKEYEDYYISKVVIAKDYRNKGFATILLNKFIEKINTRITLEVRESNEIAINLYKKFNFNIVGIRKNMYQNPNENGIVMVRSGND